MLFSPKIKGFMDAPQFNKMHLGGYAFSLCPLGKIASDLDKKYIDV